MAQRQSSGGARGCGVVLTLAMASLASLATLPAASIDAGDVVVIDRYHATSGSPRVDV